MNEQVIATQDAPSPDPAKPQAPPILLLRLVVLGVIVFAVMAGMDRIHLAKGDSVPNTLYWSMPGQRPVLGSFVTLSVSHPIIGEKPAALTKMVACDEGMTVRLVDHAFYCDDKRLGGYLTQTWDGKPLTLWPGGVVPKGEAFLMGTHPRSFDSRYFGPKPKDSMVVVRGLL